jgi:hypothetical protein
MSPCGRERAERSKGGPDFARIRPGFHARGGNLGDPVCIRRSPEKEGRCNRIERDGKTLDEFTVKEMSGGPSRSVNILWDWRVNRP